MTSSQSASRTGERQALWTLVAFFVVSRIAAWTMGVGFDRSALSGYWQLIDVELLRGDLWRSLGYLHAQPPLFNLAVGLGVRWDLLGLAPWLYGAMGLGIQLGSYRLLRAVGVGLWPAVVVSCWLVVRPGFLRLETWLMYDLPTIFLVVASAVALEAALRTEGGPKDGGEDDSRAALARHLTAWLLAALVLTRSLFHLVFLLAVLGLVLTNRNGPREKRRGRWLRAFAFPLLLVATLYGKNLWLYGDFTSSSWLGMNFARVLRAGIEEPELRRLVARGDVPPILLDEPFGELDDHSQAGVDLDVPPRWSDVPLLAERTKASGSVNYHHAGWLAVSAEYARADRALLTYAPEAWAKGALKSGFYLLQPVGEIRHLRLRRDDSAFSRYESLGRWLSMPISLRLGGSERTIFGTFLLAVPVALLAAAWWTWVLWTRPRNRSSAPGPQCGPDGRLAAFLTLTALYVVAVGCLFEIGENARFRSYIDPLLVVAVAGALVEMRRRWRPTTSTGPE